ncbi:MAG: energy-coupling factor transporter transmembrane protein EcfT [Deferribacteraceae bacterium]|jgi:energy-coupling factor transport system permease protein|nr:energy-coupling factor transporter transmembrane protein EcfT [Deferribacteraceae bacterium]
MLKAGILALHPLLKFILALILMISLSLTDTLSAKLVFLSLLIILAWITSFKAFFSTIKPFYFIFAFTFLVQLFVTRDGRFSLPNPESFINTFNITLGIFLLISFSLIFVAATSELDILRVVRYIFSPLKVFRISPDDLALSCLIALRFIPILRGEAEKIMDSQRIMGVRPKRGARGAFLSTLRASFSLIIPQFTRSFYYAAQIAVTLRYRGGDPNFFKLPPFALKERLILAAILPLPFIAFGLGC